MAQVNVGEESQQKYRPDSATKLAKREGQLVFAGVRCEPPENGGRSDPAVSNGNGYSQHVRPKRGNQLPVHFLRKQCIDVLVAVFEASAIKTKVLPMPNARHQLDSEQMGQSENGCTLALSVGVHNLRVQRFIGLRHEIQNVVAFPRAARAESREQRDIIIGNKVVTQAAPVAIANLVLRHEVLGIQIPLRAVC